jgi:hypothetical protein
MIFGFIISNCFFKYGKQAFISSGFGSLFFGGRHFTTFAIKTSSLFNQIVASISFKNLPAAQTNGFH